MLKFTLIIVHILMFITLMFAAVIVVGVMFWHISPEYYNQIELTRGFKAGYGIGGLKIHIEEPGTRLDKIFLSDLSTGAFYWLCFRGFFFITMNVLILLKIIGILHSIKSIKTFYDSNISNLKSIGVIAAIAAVMSTFNIGYVEGDWHVHFTVPWEILLVSFIAFVLAEVFAEGKQLLEDKNLIV